MTLSRSEFNLLKQSIASDGIKSPILVVEANSRNFVVDRHHRLLAAREFGFTKAPTETVKLPHGGYRPWMTCLIEVGDYGNLAI